MLSEAVLVLVLVLAVVLLLYTRPMQKQWVGLCLGTLIAACGGSTETSSGGGQGGSGGSSFCPVNPPAPSSACTVPEGLDARAHCSWGDDPRPQCRFTAVCFEEQGWLVTEPNAAACSGPPLPAACETSPPASGTVCSDTSLACYYDDGTRCICSECEGGSPYPICQTIDPPEWACVGVPDGCPVATPQAGDACSEEGLSCGQDCELPIVCEMGRWVWHQNMCPICASPATPIATPRGEQPIAMLRVGDLVYSVDDNAIVVVPIARAAHTAVFAHQVMRVTLDDGTVLEISPAHPTADGRTFADLERGTLLDGRVVAEAVLVPFAHDHTYDILPDSPSGAYFAGGALIGSTLRR